jgi:hypothetical protein
LGPYQLALPTHTLIGFTGSLFKATKGASIAGAIRNINGTHRIAAHATKSGRLIIVCLIRYKLAKSVSKKPHYVNHFLAKIFPLTH